MITKGRRRLTLYLLAIAAVIVGLGLLFLILGLTVFKAKHPITTVKSIALDDLDFSVDVSQLRVHLNLTLKTDVAVKNPNRVGFKYSNSKAFLKYRGNDVGEVPIPAGEIGARSAGDMNLTLTVMADRLISDGDFYSDVISGRLTFQIHVRLSGKVKVLVSVHVVAYADCDVEIQLTSRSVVNQICRYKTKL